MRRLEVRLRQTAQSDLNEIFQYVFWRSRSLPVAEGYTDRLLAACERIGDTPEAGRRRDDLEAGLRTWSFERSVVITYRVTRSAIEITNLFAGGRSLDAFFAQRRRGKSAP